MAQVSGEVDQVFSGLSREAALAEAEDIARRRAIEAGALEGTTKVLDSEDIPIAYLPGDARRVRVRVVGDIGYGV
jgi:N-methylhydantoinase A/oxoprolinase/acetone carboxylase beta subunit